MTHHIKPCPFCGHVGLEFHEGSTFRWLVASCVGCCATAGETRIQTRGEGTKEEWRATAEKNAIDQWNTRQIDTDCRTCKWFHQPVDSQIPGCFSHGRCLNADQYQPTAPVQLWGKK